MWYRFCSIKFPSLYKKFGTSPNFSSSSRFSTALIFLTTAGFSFLQQKSYCENNNPIPPMKVCTTDIRPEGIVLTYLLREFVRDAEVFTWNFWWNDYTIQQVVDNFIKAKVKNEAYIEYVRKTMPEAVKPATHFISYSRSYRFRWFVSVLAEFFSVDKRSNVVVWIDFLVINQDNQTKKDPEWLSEVFTKAIKTIGHTVFIADHWNQPHALSRAWCIWELFCSVKENVPLDFVLSKASKRHFFKFVSNVQRELRNDTYEDVTNRINQQISSALTIDVQNCSATFKEDKENILEAIRVSNISEERLNRALEQSLSWSLLHQ